MIYLSMPIVQEEKAFSNNDSYGKHLSSTFNMPGSGLEPSLGLSTLIRKQVYETDIDWCPHLIAEGLEPRH